MAEDLTFEKRHGSGRWLISRTGSIWLGNE